MDSDSPKQKQQRKQCKQSEPQCHQTPQSTREEYENELLNSVEELKIEQEKSKQTPSEPYALPDGYSWCTIDMKDTKIADEVHSLVSQNYTRDSNSKFCFKYSSDFLRWVLLPPGYCADWHVGVRETAESKKLVGFIAGIPVELNICGKPIKMAEINYLCVHKDLWDAQLDPVLVKEITRRINLTGISQAVFTSNSKLHNDVTTCRYYHRPLNPNKLIKTGFSVALSRQDVPDTADNYKLESKAQVPGIRVFERKDAEICWQMFTEYLKKFSLSQNYSLEEFIHWFTPRDGVINTYVVEDPISHKVTDMVSFYTLSCSIADNKEYSEIKSAYSFYTVCTKTKRTELMMDALIFAKQQEFDLFVSLGVMENGVFFSDLLFAAGKGYLRYYLYNHQCPRMQPRDVGLIIL